MGTSPTGVKTEYRPPTSSGITKVLKPSASANFLKAPFDLSVMAIIRLRASFHHIYASGVHAKT